MKQSVKYYKYSAYKSTKNDPSYYLITYTALGHLGSTVTVSMGPKFSKSKLHFGPKTSKFPSTLGFYDAEDLEKYCEEFTYSLPTFN